MVEIKDLKNLKMYRRRYIPDEKVLLKDDEVIFMDENVIVTKWKVLKPRNDFASGYSCYFLKEGFKVSKFFKDDGNLKYIYCDIIETEIVGEDEIVFHDLLIDVIVENDGKVRVVDVAEVPDALDKGLISLEKAKKSLRNLDAILTKIYNGEIKELTSYIDKYL